MSSLEVAARSGIESTVVVIKIVYGEPRLHINDFERCCTFIQCSRSYNTISQDVTSYSIEGDVSYILLASIFNYDHISFDLTSPVGVVGVIPNIHLCLAGINFSVGYSLELGRAFLSVLKKECCGVRYSKFNTVSCHKL